MCPVNVFRKKAILFQGCAVCLGFCATSHLDAVLTKLESVTKTDMAQKKGGVFGFMKVRIEPNIFKTLWVLRPNVHFLNDMAEHVL